MTDIERKKLLKAQQGELDAVLLYKKLAALMKDEDKRKKLLKVAADEGKHASIIKQYTNETLSPKPGKARLIAMLYKVLGEKFTMNLLAKGELKSIDSYSTLVGEFPRIQEIINDEALHADIARSFLS